MLIEYLLYACTVLGTEDAVRQNLQKFLAMRSLYSSEERKTINKENRIIIIHNMVEGGKCKKKDYAGKGERAVGEGC